MCRLAWTYIPRAAQWGSLPTHLHVKRLSHSGERILNVVHRLEPKYLQSFSGWICLRLQVGRQEQSSLLRHRPYRFWAPTSLLFNGYRGSFPGLRWMGPEVDHCILVRKFRISGAITVRPLYAFTWYRFIPRAEMNGTRSWPLYSSSGV
jgi:hypothetical protein